MSSDTSGDEDNLELLREAADHQFINDSMFRRDGHEEKGEKSTAKPPSQRPSEPEDQFNALGVTPEFQAYVAKRLAVNLERRLRYSFVTTDANRTGRGRKGGIKLFKDSAHFIESDVDVTSIKKRRPPAHDDPSKEKEEEAKIKAVSVSAESVLNKADVAFWSGRSKAPLFKYRRTKGGHLVSSDD